MLQKELDPDGEPRLSDLEQSDPETLIAENITEDMLPFDKEAHHVGHIFRKKFKNEEEMLEKLDSSRNLLESFSNELSDIFSDLPALQPHLRALKDSVQELKQNQVRDF